MQHDLTIKKIIQRHINKYLILRGKFDLETARVLSKLSSEDIFEESKTILEDFTFGVIVTIFETGSDGICVECSKYNK